MPVRCPGQPLEHHELHKVIAIFQGPHWAQQKGHDRGDTRPAVDSYFIDDGMPNAITDPPAADAAARALLRPAPVEVGHRQRTDPAVLIIFRLRHRQCSTPWPAPGTDILLSTLSRRSSVALAAFISPMGSLMIWVVGWCPAEYTSARPSAAARFFFRAPATEIRKSSPPVTILRGISDWWRSAKRSAAPHPASASATRQDAPFPRRQQSHRPTLSRPTSASRSNGCFERA